MGVKNWFTAAELADLALPGLSRAKRRINERAERGRWALKTDASGAPLARRRAGRGGGLEYHVQILPSAARMELARRGIATEDRDAHPDAHVRDLPPASRTWAWFEAQSDSVRAEAHRRAAIVARVEAFERSNLSRSAAAARAAAEAAIASSTLWGWLTLIEGVDPSDRLPFLAPRRIGGGAEATIDDGAWKFLVSDYLRAERPTFSSCYHRLVREYAAPRGIEVPHQRTLFRKLGRDVDPRLVIARREGADALRRTLPPQKRSVKDLHALELVNIDGHMFDVFTKWPDGRVGRPMMVAIQDVYSRKILAWRIGETESAILTRLTFATLFTNWGIPRGCLLDNGRAFASKMITGGAKSRFRFKIRDEEPTGLLTALGVHIHWATPYRGQSKPIERAFRDLCDTIARHPAMAGAYTGNRPDAKPENYGSRAVQIDLFNTLAENGIAAHNARGGRRTETARGASFDDVFEASYVSSPIGRATPEQLRLALLAADDFTADRQSGAITLHGNRYWGPELSQIAGKRVTVRFDPDDLTLPIHVYDRFTGAFLTSAPILEQCGFLDAASAKARARQEAELKKTIRRAEEMEQLLSAADLAAMMPDYSDEGPVPQPVVLRPVRHRGMTAAALKPDAQDTAPAPNFIDRFSTGMGQLRIVE